MKLDARSFALQVGAAIAIAVFAALPLTRVDAAERISKAADYPHKPIRIIDPFVPGGASDVIARLVGQKLTDRFGQAVIVESRPGAGGNVGAEIAAKATPDG